MLLTIYFSPEVWGTVSDWVMIFVTTLTAYFLYKTLRSQKEVQRTQNDLFKIENIRFKESIKPLLSYSAHIDKLIPGEENKKILTIEVSNETPNIALYVSRILSPKKASNQIFVPMGLSDRKNHLVKGDKPLLYHFLLDKKDPLSEWVTFEINYNDIAGANYKQQVICICDNFGIEINAYLPEVI